MDSVLLTAFIILKVVSSITVGLCSA